MSDVFIDSKFTGNVKDGKQFAQNIIEERRMGKLSSSTNVYYDPATNEVYVETSRGRTVRPLLVVRDGKPLLAEKQVEQLAKGEITWTDIVKQGLIEYLDSAEEEMALVALSPKDLTTEHTHLEVSSLDMLGIISSLVPFAHHNQGARLMQGSKNQKQSVGFYAANFHTRIDMDTNILHYPQIPVVSTIMYDVLKYKDHPSGMNVTVAIMSYKGYNMDDALIINGGSVQRGLARSTYFRPVQAEELRYSGGLIDQIEIPDTEVRGYRTEHDYRFLDEDGLVGPESCVAEGDVVIGKTSPPRFLSSMDEYNLTMNYRRESSKALKHGERGVVDFVALTENDEGNKMVRVRLRDPRIPEIGDKFTSRHGQKGVLSLIVPEADMPFTASGVRPDLLFSPHGLPKRMTISHMIELLGGKTGSLGGRYVDGTVFNSESEESLRKELRGHGFRENGSEIMYNGETGEQLTARIFVGNMYYLRLKHMVANKVHSRARGPIQLLTRQPTEGKAKEGGLRLGEMEKDTFVAHGATLLLKERFDSDTTIIPISEQSGLVGFYDGRRNDKPTCTLLGDEADMYNVELSYAFKLFLDELMSLGIYPKLELQRKF